MNESTADTYVNITDRGESKQPIAGYVVKHKIFLSGNNIVAKTAKFSIIQAIFSKKVCSKLVISDLLLTHQKFLLFIIIQLQIITFHH